MLVQSRYTKDKKIIADSDLLHIIMIMAFTLFPI